MGCCLGVLLLAGAPRVALLLWWFMDPLRIEATFSSWSASVGGFIVPQWGWPLLGLFVLPWTTVAYILVFPGGIGPIGWAVVVFGLLLDLSAHGGSGRAYRKRRKKS